ncbi:bifunctional 23S rRNA (guanine(2069)-N(7))-methyltransferase RlmK/23S rRNA (guanine(2445)-N(2))-methyltransferase RlmL [Gilvimarinus agarilyticus]|uniref:bifunctional 23S rRNA (guanine(2069)-N(7))-methyltransferase RlmK/23S rRNA (guanine(2445)-N(2))-methyltransferase RlmL n=1 Tax=Gilvimarinus sp. 2_MG-2023 TaxID=3062666 RepID=UPI001C0A036C|nr:bifunctional 23S rRNA (guanine(2069)-N(7))-methyltransferase RlmK/23S rRNA (guanine(2445)-N(2))-methyltransferase RlmL [Gilvimarinus sp. 2_MG-2023]MBU2887006.1 bifunctional 23S rRNA (guanine(2069)-N(7))-methyltransferase RlmK/23S rRNA (guanine(2445)-N(2))-methyltransferase RlmL [Gilvimarinus agarilyticus]MDO6571666.1 bifunctional 23S rRNA (guanine(2069)-N(7))-methyltransferase RlmK/23S rRNA (guanine(2445)-N(2))-methyltransferase RlmL [Gilvimarinus sp. 2_MG-2023]
MTMQFFATCPKGLEGLLKTELEGLGAEQCRETVAGVYFEGELSQAYKACLWSRLANKILLPLTSGAVKDAEDLYELVFALPWHEHLQPEGTLLVDFSGQNNAIRNTQFGAVKVKDAIVDKLRQVSGSRPSVDKAQPDIRINARLSKGKLVVSLDLCGDSLHRRGYRQQQGQAPLKENLAAAILLRSGWCQETEQSEPELALIDPMCGSGTFLIEAAMIAADIAPGLGRAHFAFERWLGHDASAWQTLQEDAKARRMVGLAREDLPEIRGYDANLKVIRAAEQNIVRAGLDDWLRVTRKELRELKRPTHSELTRGLILTNPPYGERLGEVESMKILYAHLGERLRAEFTGWRAGIFTGNPELGKNLGMRSNRKYKLFNGAIASELLLFDINPEQFYKETSHEPAVSVAVDNLAPVPSSKPELSNGAQMLVNRISKNHKALKRFFKRTGTNAYRLYDADMPEYACAIDVYQGQSHQTGAPLRLVHVQEYQAPKTVDEARAAERFAEIQAAVPVALEVDESQVSYKQRRRNRGLEQYEKQSERIDGESLVLTEGQAKLLVNPWPYLDTGVFLDHRPVRLKIAEQAKNKRFLNLFCYTASASIHAAVGGARYTTSVDMSQTYLNWARRNLALNGLSESKNRLIQADCLKWLNEADGLYDIILLDPPTFSNSKRMDSVLDVQRDHVDLISKAMKLLDQHGVLYFSNNLRDFRMEIEALSEFQLTDITSSTIDEDFNRNKKIHHCWEIRHGQ